MARILVVDDEIEMRELIVDMVAEAGHQPSAAANGKEALKAIRKQPFDVVITDIVMPKKSGANIIRELRAKHSATGIIAISGGDGRWPEDGYLGEAKLLGAHRVLAKPFRGDELLTMIEELTARA
jgi:DNA-binding response OmpR family regulator